MFNKMVRLIFVAILVIATTPFTEVVAHAQVAQGATPIQAAPAHLDGCTNYVGVDAIATATTTQTITPTGSTGYVVIYEIDWTNVEGAAAVTAAGTSKTTTTNLGGVNWIHNSGTATAGQTTQTFQATYGPGGLRSQTPGTAVTFVLPAVITNQGIHFNLCYATP